ncbi:uncharacterized protein LOC122267194 [Penaeus japonicus]|uniref:uncharacterized protein LOC122267194 n=2 Tax=Penaeus japonicus TaxID=27405 RepID=UPI001C7119B4|nr:uncharacterized protein LOC122267194 [Penaeus japonicus]
MMFGISRSDFLSSDWHRCVNSNVSQDSVKGIAKSKEKQAIASCHLPLDRIKLARLRPIGQCFNLSGRNMNAQLLLLLALAAVAASDSQPSSFYGVPRVRTQESDESSEKSSESRYIYRNNDRSDEDSAEYGPAKYDFDWAVKHDYSGNHFGHQESRDGDYTQGSYYVQLPDSRLQTVKYYVDGDSGYVAEVEYEGEAQYPESSEYRVSSGRYSAQDSDEEDSSESHVRAPSRFYGSPV